MKDKIFFVLPCKFAHGFYIYKFIVFYVIFQFLNAFSTFLNGLYTLDRKEQQLLESFEALEGDKYHFLDSGRAFWGSINICLPYSDTLSLAFAVGHCWRQSSRLRRTFDLSWYGCYTTFSPSLSIIPNHMLGDHILNKFILCHRIHCCIAWSHTVCVLLCVLHITYIELFFTEDSPPSDS